VKQDEEALFEARNIADLTTEGIDLNYRYRFGSSNASTLSLSYTYMIQEFGEDVFAFSRYTIDNDLKHHFTAQLSGRLIKTITGSLNVKWIERASDRRYTVVDATLN
jgi:outer membrane receptor for ferrienterochelin and colicin